MVKVFRPAVSRLHVIVFQCFSNGADGIPESFQKQCLVDLLHLFVFREGALKDFLTQQMNIMRLAVTEAGYFELHILTEFKIKLAKGSVDNFIPSAPWQCLKGCLMDLPFTGKMPAN